MGSLSFLYTPSGIAFIIKLMEKMRTRAAGIDIGSRQVFVGLEQGPVRSFGTFTEDLLSLRDHLLEHQVDTVAMEATGRAWMYGWWMAGRRDSCRVVKQMCGTANGYNNYTAMACLTAVMYLTA